MKNICKEVSYIKNMNIFDEIQKKYNIQLPNEVISFFKDNNGGIPTKNIIESQGEEYEVRCFLSFNSGEYNSIELPVKSFLDETKGKIFPLAKDSADNYFCINLETGKLYFWNHDDNLYYRVSESFEEFISYFMN